MGINMPQFSREKRPFLVIVLFYYFGFLLITPIGSFNPGVPRASSYSITQIDRHDDTLFYMKAKSVIVDHDVDYNNEHLALNDLLDLNSLANSNLGAATQIGPALLWSPFVLLAHGLTKVLNVLGGFHLSEDGYGPLYLAMTCIGSSLFVLLGLFISFNILRRYFSQTVAVLAVLTVFVGNTIFYNAYVRMLMSHAPGYFSASLCCLLFIKLLERKERSDYILFGLSYGLNSIVRYENAFIFLALPLSHIVFVTWRNMRSEEKRTIGTLIANYGYAGVAAFVVFLPQLVHFYMQSGELLPSSLKQMGSSIMTKPVNITHLLLSGTRNIVWGNPVIAIGTAGTFFFMKRNRLLGLGFFLVIAASFTWLFWRPNYYWWGMDFGIRHLIKLSLPLAVGYAAIADSLKGRYKVRVAMCVSILIMAWEYLKIIQTPVITPILSENFLVKAALKVPDLTVRDILLGTESSSVRILVTYGFKLRHPNLNDFLFLIVLPLFVLLASFSYLKLFSCVETKFYANPIWQKMTAVLAIFFSIMLSFVGLAYPKKSADKLFYDFKNAGFLALASNSLDKSAEFFTRAASIRPSDEVVSTFLNVENKGKWPPSSYDPSIVNMLVSASHDENHSVREYAQKALDEYRARTINFSNTGKLNIKDVLSSSSNIYGDGWTNGNGVINNLEYKIKRGDEYLVLEGVKSTFANDPERLMLKVYVNEVPLNFTKQIGKSFFFKLSGDIGVIKAIEVKSSAFVPMKLGISADKRTLGIMFMSVRISKRLEV